VVAVSGEIVERCVYPSEKSGFDQLELDLFQWAAVELSSDLNFQTTLSRRGNDGIGFVKFVGNGGLEQNVQPGFDSHQTDFSIGIVIDTDYADLWRSFADQQLDIGIARDC